MKEYLKKISLVLATCTFLFSCDKFLARDCMERAEVSMISILSLLMKLLSLRAVVTGTTVAFGRDYFSMIGVLRMMPFKLHGSIFIKS